MSSKRSHYSRMAEYQRLDMLWQHYFLTHQGQRMGRIAAIRQRFEQTIKDKWPKEQCGLCEGQGTTIFQVCCGHAVMFHEGVHSGLDCCGNYDEKEEPCSRCEGRKWVYKGENPVEVRRPRW